MFRLFIEKDINQKEEEKERDKKKGKCKNILTKD